MNKCPRCGGTESFKDNAGWLDKELNWCSRCGYLMEPLENLSKAIEEKGIPVFKSTLELPEDNMP